tara:strand:+ start:322 stop:603 length:282 start_codon:yes stop_codon:yes gene_type:complete
MNIEGLNLVCGKCAQWFDSTTHRDSKLVHDETRDWDREVFICTCGEDLDDAHECNIQTPYSAIMVDILSTQLQHAEALVNDIQEKIAEHGGKI